MDRESIQLAAATLETTAPSSINKVKPDLVVLTYMAHLLYTTLQQSAASATSAEPLSYFLEDCQQRKHRIILYQLQELLRPQPLSFVGFVSGRKETATSCIINEVERIDELMVTELVNIAGIFSYSSLQVRPGRWYNLVVFCNAATKTHLKRNATHSYAAYHLAPQYYEWIRLHNGVIPDGLAQQKLLVQSTRYYTFTEDYRRPDMQEITYGRHSIMTSI